MTTGLNAQRDLCAIFNWTTLLKHWPFEYHPAKRCLPFLRERAIWFDGCVRTYLERDLQDLSSIAALPDSRRLMRALCLRLGQLVNQTELGCDVARYPPPDCVW